jgi:hypothetical protein
MALTVEQPGLGLKAPQLVAYWPMAGRDGWGTWSIRQAVVELNRLA